MGFLFSVFILWNFLSSVQESISVEGLWSTLSGSWPLLTVWRGWVIENTFTERVMRQTLDNWCVQNVPLLQVQTALGLSGGPGYPQGGRHGAVQTNKAAGETGSGTEQCWYRSAQTRQVSKKSNHQHWESSRVILIFKFFLPKSKKLLFLFPFWSKVWSFYELSKFIDLLFIYLFRLWLLFHSLSVQFLYLVIRIGCCEVCG